MEIDFNKTLFEFALLFMAISAISLFFKRLRLPIVLAPILFGFFMRYTPLASHLQTEEFLHSLGILSNFGIIFLLFYIGMQLDFHKFKQYGKPILQLTAYSIMLPLAFGFLLIWGMGYGLFLAFIIGLTRIPVAEAIVVPILDEFGLIKTKVGQFIIGPGVLDDVVEVALITIVSVWLANYYSVSLSISPLVLFISILSFIIITWISYRWLLPFFGRRIDHSLHGIMIFCMAILLIFAVLAKFSKLGLVIGALTAGIAIRPWLYSLRDTSRKTIIQTIEITAYGFVGVFFFYEVGLLVEPQGILLHPFLVLGLFLAGTLGKLFSALLLVPAKSLTFKEALVVGVGLDVRMTTELIIAKMLFFANAIDTTLYTALIAAASISMITVPTFLSILLHKWGKDLKRKVAKKEYHT